MIHFFVQPKGDVDLWREPEKMRESIDRKIADISQYLQEGENMKILRGVLDE